jgi:Protein of unknown function (DUF3800)
MMVAEQELPVAICDSNHEVLVRLIEILVPGDGDLMAFLECYFDESGSHDGSPVLCVAGYLFERDSCKTLDLEWKKVLDRYDLPFFRMSSCAHGNWPFKKLGMEDRIEAEKSMIALIGQHALIGLSIAVNEHDYNVLFGSTKAVTGDAYSFCCWQILAGIQSWIARNNFEGDVAYFFEAGHASEPQANALMGKIFQEPRLRQRYRYAAHAFVDKVKVRPVQTADLLAWQTATQMKRWLNNMGPRADFEALMKKPRHELFIANRKTLGGVIAYHRSLQGLPIAAGITGRLGQSWFWCPFDGGDGFAVERFS